MLRLWNIEYFERTKICIFSHSVSRHETIPPPSFCYSLYFCDLISRLTLGLNLRSKRHIKEQNDCVICDAQGVIMSLRIIYIFTVCKTVQLLMNTHTLMMAEGTQMQKLSDLLWLTLCRISLSVQWIALTLQLAEKASNGCHLPNASVSNPLVFPTQAELLAGLHLHLWFGDP